MAASGILGPDPVFAQTMLRVKDPQKSRHFYEKLLGMKYMTNLEFPDLTFSLNFYSYVDEESPGPDATQSEKAQWLWSRRYHTMELTHNWGTENDENFKHHNGNTPPLGYGCTAIWINDVQAAVDSLRNENVKISMEPLAFTAEGQNVAFVQDPDGYDIMLGDRPTKSSGEDKGLLGPDPVISSTQWRIKDPKRSISFYNDLGLQLLAKEEMKDLKFTLYYLGYPPSQDKFPGESGDPAASQQWISSSRYQTLCLKHIWGTEEDDSVEYHNGNKDPKGFGHIGFIVSDVEKVISGSKEKGTPIIREAKPFQDCGVLGFITDPDGYWIEIIARNGAEQPEPYVL